MRVSVLSLGCKVNQAESSSIEAGLRANGWTVVALEDKPDFCIINTCSVTAKSDYQSRQLIRRAHRAGSKVVVTGCYAELNREGIKSMDGVAMIIDNARKDSIANMLQGETSCSRLSPDSSGRSRQFIKVQDGCNNSCSYCIIPAARGSSRSMAVDSIVDQINTGSGIYNEVVLTAIHLGTYGYDLIPHVTLADLLRTCLDSTSIKRIRLSSLEITEIGEELLELFREERICKHLHIPLQSGDDRILKLMNRRYDQRDFCDKILNIHKLIPDVCIGTDVIAGFPGETDGEFQNTYDLLESLPISYIHVFPFSPRPGTVAAKLRQETDSAIIKERCDLVRRLSARKKADYMKSQIGSTLDLLVEKTGRNLDVHGITGNYLRVRAVGCHASPKDVVPVRIAAVQDEALLAYPI